MAFQGRLVIDRKKAIHATVDGLIAMSVFRRFQAAVPSRRPSQSRLLRYHIFLSEFRLDALQVLTNRITIDIHAMNCADFPFTLPIKIEASE